MIADDIAFYSMIVGVMASIFLLFLVFLALILDKHKVHYKKPILFISIIIATVVPTLFFIGSTLYLNFTSSSKGPVHWHADIEVWACGKELDFLDPKGLSNKVGTAILHEHNDKRIHLEGVVVEDRDASLSNFFTVIGGSLNNQVLSVPTNNGIETFVNGTACPDGSEGRLQVFVYRAPEGVYKQEKLVDIEDYIISPLSQVPNGDCVIVEYGEEKASTDKMCRSYKVAEEIGKLKPAQTGSMEEGVMYGN